MWRASTELRPRNAPDRSAPHRAAPQTRLARACEVRRTAAHPTAQRSGAARPPARPIARWLAGPA
jgi:hypothetical protein